MLSIKYLSGNHIFSLKTWIFKRSCIHNTKMTMNNIYLRHLDGEDSFQVSFHCVKEEMKINRQFNLSRKISEPVSDFLGRITMNLQKVVQRKFKKKKKLVSCEDTNLYTNFNAELYSHNILVSLDSKCEDVFFGKSDNKHITLHVLGIEYIVVVNGPWVNSISLPRCMMAGFAVYPKKLNIIFGDKKNSSLNWFKSVNRLDGIESSKSGGSNLPIRWENVGIGLLYIPQASDIDCKVKLEFIPGNETCKGPIVETISTTSIQAGPGFCPFEHRHAFTNEHVGNDSFRVVSYNILADLYAETDAAQNHLFPYCPPYAMALDYRKQLYLKEILGYNADIICLQEVDSKVFEQDLKDVLEEQRCDGVFCKKGATVNEGVACFYSTNKFKLIESHRIVLGEELESTSAFSYIWQRVKENDTLKCRLTERTTTLQVLVLESLLRPGHKLVVGNTHLYFHPKADHIRLLQAAMAVTYLNQIMATVAASYPDSQLSLLLCGDFNSTPECGVYKLMTTNNVPEDYPEWRSEEGEEVEGLTLHHPLSLESACGTPEFTNYTAGFAGCLDYIFYQTDYLSVEQVIPFPSTEELSEHVALPSVVFPSDHIALVADLKWKGSA